MSLIDEAKKKDPDAFGQLVQENLQKMYRIAISILQNEEDAADAIQETMLKCWQKINQVRNEDYFETWLIRTLINQCKDILKCRKRTVLVDDIPEAAQEDNYTNTEWKAVLRVLHEKYRIVLELYYVEGFSTKEIATMMHITDASVRTRLVRGRKQLEQMFRER